MTPCQWTLLILLTPPAVVTAYYLGRAALVVLAMRSGEDFE